VAAQIHFPDLIERSPIHRFCQSLWNRPLLVIPLFLCLYGYGTIDTEAFRILSAAPLTLHPDTGRQFLQFSPVVYFLGYPFTQVFGATWSFAFVMGGGLVLFAAALRRFAAVRYGDHQRDAMLMVFATPLLIVLTQYLGKSDLFMVSAFLLLVVTPGLAAQIALGAIVVLGHFEMGLLMLTTAIVLGILPRRAVLGAIAGLLLLYGYHYVLLPAVPQSRATVGTGFLNEALTAVTNTPILHLIFTFGAFWICVLTAWPLSWRWRIVFVGTLGLASVTLDFTRVFTLLALPMIIAVIDGVLSRPADRPPAWLAILPLLAFVQAHLLSGYVFDSRMPQIVGRVIERLAR